MASASNEASLLHSKQFVVLQISCLLSMDCTPRIPTKHVVKKIRSIIVLEFLNNQMDDHLPLALLELDLSMS